LSKKTYFCKIIDEMKQNNNTILLCTALILAAVFSRIVFAETGWYNLAPLVAISIFSGAILKNKSYAFIIPLAAYLLSDVYMQVAHGTGFYGISQFFVYGAMALVVLLGSKMNKIQPLRVLGFTIGGSLLFWLISNFGVFAEGYYGYSANGLAQTFLAAIPFYKNEFSTKLFFNPIIGNVVTSGILFAAYAVLKNRVAAPKAIAG